MKSLPKARLHKKFTIIASLLIGSMSFFMYASPAGTAADTSLSNELNTLETQMQQLTSQIQNEKGQIHQLNGQIQNTQSAISDKQQIISQTEQLISEKQQQIGLLNQSISQEQTEIADLTAKKNQLYSLFEQRAKASYEINFLNPILIALGNSSIESAFSNLEYFAATRKEDSSLLSAMENNEYILQQKLADLTAQQTDLQNAQNQLVSEKNGLAQEEADLQSQLTGYKATANNVQHQLTTNQAKYQAIVSQLNALSVGAYSGGGCVQGNWWYYNQQCYGRLPGMYGTSINMQVGCLITSIAMVATRELGPSYNPPYVASQTYFDAYGDMMVWPNLPIGPHYIGDGNLSAINDQLAQGNPVIVYLAAPYGQHWVVFYQNLGGGDYIINDPWYGSGLHFLGSNGHEYYSDGEIGSAYTLY